MTIKRMPAPDFVVESAPGPLTGRYAEADALAGAGPGKAADSTAQRTRRHIHHALNAGDGTHQLLVSGAWTMLVGLAAGLLTVFVFGGVGPQGAHSNPGWLSLMVAMMAAPFAILLLLLGGAKWLRNLSRCIMGVGRLK